MGNVVDSATMARIVITTATSSAIGTVVGMAVADLARSLARKISNEKVRIILRTVLGNRALIAATASAVVTCILLAR